MFEIQRSGDKTSSGEIGLDIRMYKRHFNRIVFIKNPGSSWLEISVLCVRVPLWARIFHFVFCRFRRAPGRLTVLIQMRSNMTFIKGNNR